ncbi:MAG: type IV toxin-antitoxin system AbiEi family antitoxin domain-containing protein [Thermoplasmata archaeon]
MNIQQDKNTYYSSLSKNEAHILGSVRSTDLLVFGVKEIEALSGLTKTSIHNTLSNLVRKGHIVRIKRNTYALEDVFFDSTFKIMTEAVKPSYISFWTSLSYYGFTEQQVQTIQLVSTKQFDDLKVRNKKAEISTFDPSKFFGYIDIEGMIIAEREKALIDSLYMMHKCGGLEEYVKCLKNAFDELDKDRLERYIIRFNNKTLVSRIGFLLDELGLTDRVFLDQLKKYVSKSYVLLDPNGSNIEGHNSRWKIKINRDLEALL